MVQAMVHSRALGLKKQLYDQENIPHKQQLFLIGKQGKGKQGYCE